MQNHLGGFQLVDLIITKLKDHMTCYKLKCSHWWKIYVQVLILCLSYFITTVKTGKFGNRLQSKENWKAWPLLF